MEEEKKVSIDSELPVPQKSARKRNMLTSTITSEGRGEVVRNGDWVIIQFPDASKKLCRIQQDRDMKVMGKRVLCNPIIGAKYGSSFQLTNSEEATNLGKSRNAIMHKQMEEARDRKRRSGRPQKKLEYAALELVDVASERKNANDRLLKQRLEELEADIKRTKELLEIGAEESASTGGNGSTNTDQDQRSREQLGAPLAGATKGLDNRRIFDDNRAQRLSAEDIHALIAAKDGSAVVEALREGSETFEKRTEFSKDKYIKRKVEKYVLRITIFPCVTQSVAEALYLKTTIPGGKLHGMRWDTVPLLLNGANVHAGNKTMVVDTIMGLMLGAVMERMGGYGSVYSVYFGRQQTRSGLQYFNFTNQELESIHFRNSLALCGDDESKGTIRSALEEVDGAQSQGAKEREHFLDVEENSMDSLVIATDFVPESIVVPLLKYLAPSRPFAVYFRSSDPLVRCQRLLEQSKQVCDIRLSENILAEHQVLPARTHPHMRTTSYGGYVLVGTKILPDPGSPSTRAKSTEQPSPKRMKLDSST